MDHTFNDELLESYMFDSSSSMDLFKRYFTTLQLLRIARQRINDNIAEWESLCSSMDGDGGAERSLSKNSFLRDDLGDEAPRLETWRIKREKMDDVMKELTAKLLGRIERKTEEVESLQDGVWRACNPPPSNKTHPRGP